MNGATPALRIAATAWLAAQAASAQLFEVGNRLLSNSPDQGHALYGDAVAAGDIDADGDDDLVVGARFWDHVLSGQNDNGMFEVFLSEAGRDFISWSAFYVPATDSFYGTALVLGNFDSDAALELAVGAPGFASTGGMSPQAASGRVDLFDWDGSTFDFVASLSQADLDGSSPEPSDHFGASLAVGFFNNDNFQDLIIGVPDEDFNAEDDTGMIHVVYGSAAGLTTSGNIFFFADNIVPGTSNPGDRFGYALAVGDFDDDGLSDLAIGAPYRAVNAAAAAGAVHVLYGSLGGLDTAGNQLLTDGSFALASEPNDHFGFALATEDFNYPGFAVCLFGGDCSSDLAIGVPGQDLSFNGSTRESAGKVLVAYGDSATDQILTTGYDYITQDLLSFFSGPEANDRFGESLAAGAFDRSATLNASAADLVIGVPFEDWTDVDSGLLHLAFGSNSGITTASAQQVPRPFDSIDAGEAGDQLAHALAAGDFDGDGWGDLAIGIPSRDVGAVANCGAVQIVFGALFANGFESGNYCAWNAPLCL